MASLSSSSSKAQSFVQPNSISSADSKLNVRYFTSIPPNFKNATLLFPSTGMAGVGQLASWDIISSGNSQRIAIFNDDALDAILSIKQLKPSGPESKQISVTSMEMWQLSPSYYIIHFESAVFSHLRKEFISRFLSWILVQQFSNIVTFGGSNCRVPLAKPGQYAFVSVNSPFPKQLVEFNLSELIPFEQLDSEQKLSIPQEPIFQSGLPIVNSGFLRMFHAQFIAAMGTNPNLGSDSTLASDSNSKSTKVYYPTFLGICVYCFEGYTQPIVDTLKKMIITIVGDGTQSF